MGLFVNNGITCGIIISVLADLAVLLKAHPWTRDMTDIELCNTESFQIGFVFIQFARLYTVFNLSVVTPATILLFL